MLNRLPCLLAASLLPLGSMAQTYPDLGPMALATGLFSHGKNRNAQRNDGILLHVLLNDRAIRLWQSAGYGQTWNAAAKAVASVTETAALRFEVAPTRSERRQ